jgi:hypothetical protein
MKPLRSIGDVHPEIMTWGKTIESLYYSERRMKAPPVQLIVDAILPALDSAVSVAEDSAEEVP